MKFIILIFGVTISTNVFAQTKGKIVPINKSILKLSEDTTEKSIGKKLPSGYVIRVNKITNKKDTLISYKELILLDKKRRV